MQCSALAGMPDFFRKSITQNRKSLRIGPVIKFVQVTHRLQGFRLIFRRFEAADF